MRIIEVENLKIKGKDNMHVRRIVFKRDLGQVPGHGINGQFFYYRKNSKNNIILKERKKKKSH